jgi:hypothetical protein
MDDCNRCGLVSNDERTIGQLATEALGVQDACNLTGVLHGFARSLARLRVLLGEPGTVRLNQHPIAKLWADKVAQLAGVQGGPWALPAYREVWELERGEVTIGTPDAQTQAVLTTGLAPSAGS